MARYEITVDAVVGPLVVEALEGFEVAGVSHGHSRLVGDVVDQAALHAMLNRLQNLRVDIIEIHRVDDA